MSLESATFISQLVSTNPLSTDKKKQGDDHLRLLKAALQSTFPNADRAFYIPHSVAKSADYTVQATDNNKTFLCDTTAAFTLTLPTLSAADDLWGIEVIKVTTDVNPVWIAPPSGTINGFTKVRRAVEFVRCRIIWTGTAFVASRAFSDPIGSVVEFYGAALPNGLLWPDGQTFLAADFVELNSKLGGNVKPDKRGRLAAGRDTMGVGAASRLTTAGGGVDGATLGAVGGAQSKTLTEANLPPHAHGQTAQNPTFNLNVSTANDFQRNAAGGGVTAVSVGAGTNFTTSSDLTPGNTDNGLGTSTAIPILPPAIVANFGIVTE